MFNCRFTRRALLSTLALGWALLAGHLAMAQDKFIVMASTTSTEQSGLFAHLLPAFKQATGIQVRVVALGTGQALDSARRGDADVVFVHDQAAEDKFVAEGFGVKRLPVMYNDFVLIGPKGDPAGVRGKDIGAALKKLASGSAAFVSRGDKSGTHAAELRYWKADGRQPGRLAACQEGPGPGLRRLGRIPCRPGGDRRLPDRRRTAVLSQRSMSA